MGDLDCDFGDCDCGGCDCDCDCGSCDCCGDCDCSCDGGNCCDCMPANCCDCHDGCCNAFFNTLCCLCIADDMVWCYCDASYTVPVRNRICISKSKLQGYHAPSGNAPVTSQPGYHEQQGNQDPVNSPVTTQPGYYGNPGQQQPGSPGELVKPQSSPPPPYSEVYPSQVTPQVVADTE